MAILSVVVPAYNEEAMLPKTVDVLESVLSKEGIDYELVFVDDGSADGTWEKICEVCGSSAKIKGIHFSRNFGSGDFCGIGMCVRGLRRSDGLRSAASSRGSG